MLTTDDMLPWDIAPYKSKFIIIIIITLGKDFIGYSNILSVDILNKLFVLLLLGEMKKCDVTASGVIETGEQYGMHLETQVCLTLPEEGYYVVMAATQVMAPTQTYIAKLLGITTNEYVY